MITQKFYLSPVTPNGTIVVRAVMEGEGETGDMWVEIGPKGDFCGTPFADLEKLGPGEHELPVDEMDESDDAIEAD